MPQAALVTGGGQRIGRACAMALAEAGFAVAVHYLHSAEEAAAVAATINGNGGKAIALAADLGDEDAVIVGLWQVTFVSKNSPGIPDGAVIDAGYATWHSDGTEIMNSGRPPITGNFCMGVWKEVGRSKFRLNHVALSWDPSGANLVGPANIREEVTVDHTGNTYVGTFTIDQFDNAGNTLAHITGRVTGQRITVN